MLETEVLTRADLQHIFTVLLALWAWKLGDKPEQAIGAILVATIVADYSYHALIEGRGNYVSADMGHFAIDLFTFVAVAPVAHYANRIYPLWIAAAQLIAISMHLARELNAMVDPLAYAVLIRIPFYLAIGAFLVGLFNHTRRTRKWGTYPAWRSSSPRS
ncbi:hypothetical protein [Altererythrobacter aquiaggeris]|uniref:hypothetical protein n=1 Tax=Aestuarierythrobacter aquiaggeris TaxID=1898396 RepID=UPI00301AB836